MERRSPSSKKKLLIIVGGGAYGCIPAHFLGMLPKELRSLNGVDCLAGCSIGGILAAAYATGCDFRYVDKFFQKNADKCFTKRLVAKFNPLACPTYATEGLDAALGKLLLSGTMSDTRKVYPLLDLFIPALNITDDKYKVFDNISEDDLNIPLVDICAITSAAPSYYAGRELNGKCYIDGGLIEVAPLITAATSLKGKRGVEFSDMDVLMIGTGKDVDDKPLDTKSYNDLGLLGIATKVIVPYATLSNELATVYWGNNMGFNSFTYWNPCTHNGQLDDVSQIPEMLKQCEKHRKEFIETYKNWVKR